MNGLKRFIPPGFAISIIGHVGALVLGLLFVGANYSSVPVPPKTMPPDAMLVDIMPPNEAPRFEGTPADLATSGSQSSSNSNNASAAAQPPPPTPPAQSPQQPQQRPAPQRDARQAAAQPQKAEPQKAEPPMAHSEKGQPETAQPVTAQPEATQPETATPQASEPPPSAPQPHAEETPNQPIASENYARLALLGGQLGGGFEAPAVNAPNVAHDFTVAFRERVSSCSALPAGLNFTDKIAILVRVSFNPDGTLASPPQVNGAVTSQKAQALMQSAISALERCQPYAMLPADKYREWKTLDLVFSPINFFSR
jgi:outer membrane biosynthesis protein TonB